MADVPFLGCKISLISKCDIRYEGILYCVDPKESTISLSKVRSYGTETRGDPANFVPPKNDVYDVIIFRASDVKDLRVDAPGPPGLSDPAIISARQSSSKNATFDGLNITGSLPISSSGPSHQDTRRDERRDERRDDRRDDRRDERRDDRRDDRRDERRDDRRDERRDDRPDDRKKEDRGGSQQTVNRAGYNRNGASNRRGHHYGDSKGPMNRGRGGPFQGGRRGRSGDRTGDRNGDRNGDKTGAPRDHHRPAPRGPHRPGPRGPHNKLGPRGPHKPAPLKFEGEYDFDRANQLFIELDSKFKELKVKDGEKNENGESSGARTYSKSPTGSGYDSDEHKDGDSKDGGSEPADFYDKSRSFFDNISCEASERGQGKIGKPDWRKERQTNAETFGISANYRRGGYRGRSFGANGYHRR